MPPRRSSRSTRASIDPQPEPIPAKRKREDPHEKENILSKQTKSRSKVKDLQEIPESDVDNEEEQEDSPPPVKKSRPSLDPESDEEESQPKSRKALGKGKGAKKVIEDERSTRRGKRAVSSKSMAESSGEEDAASDEGVKPKTKRAAPKARRAAPVSDDEEDSDQATNMSDFDDDMDVKPAKKAKGKRASTKSKPKATAAKSKGRSSVAPSRPDTEGEDAPAVTIAAPVQEEDEEEEGPLLFNPPPMPTPSQMSQPAVEEPTGPKSRLVIHKMALVNFKSYAGRQEIGPFHKVCSAASLNPDQHINHRAELLVDCGSQWLGKVEHYRRSFIRFRIPRLEDATRKVERANPQLSSVSRSG